VSLLAYAGFDLGAKSVVLLITGAFTLVYVLATAAAVRLLPRHSWARVAALVSLACSLVLLLLTGVHLLWGLAVAAAALVYETVAARSRRQVGVPEPLPCES